MVPIAAWRRFGYIYNENRKDLRIDGIADQNDPRAPRISCRTALESCNTWRAPFWALPNCMVWEIRTRYLNTPSCSPRSVGDTTDVVQKEMYTFNDKRAARSPLKPEGHRWGSAGSGGKRPP